MPPTQQSKADLAKKQKNVEDKTFGLKNKNKSKISVSKPKVPLVEKKQYGWFWVCPNGGKDCHYRHALLEEEAEKIPIEEEIEHQHAKLTTSTPMTPELFMQRKKKKIAERDASLAAQQAERAKNDHMSGRELFLSDSSLVMDDAKAYEKYQRESRSDITEQKDCLAMNCPCCWSNKEVMPVLGGDMTDVNGNSAGDGPSSSTNAGDVPKDEDDDELDMDELNELEASLSKTSLQIQEPGTHT